MRKGLAFFVMGVFLLVPVLAAAGGGGTVTIPSDAYQALLKRLEALEKKEANSVTISKQEYQALLQRIEKLEREKGEALSSGGHCQASQADLSNTALLPQKSGLELPGASMKERGLSLYDRINLGAEIRTRVDNFYLDDHFHYVYDSQGRVLVNDRGEPLAKKGSLSNDNHWTNRFRINMDAAVDDAITFHARLAVYKNWGDSNQNRSLTDMAMAHTPDDTDIKVDRFFVDWQLPYSVPVALTIGRLPTTEGPPLGYREFRKRQSVFPALILDAEMDGVIASVGLEKYIGLNDAGIRLLYAKGYQDADDMVPYLDSRSAIDDTNVFGVQLESDIPFIERSCLALTAIWASDLNSGGVDMGDMGFYGIHAQASKVMDTALDLFVSAAINDSDPNGDFGSEDYTLILPGGSTTIFSVPVGMLSTDGDDDHTGWAVYAGARYQLPFPTLNNPYLGFEYNHGSKYWYSMTPASIDLLNRLATRGDAFDFYYLQAFNKFVTMRTGFTYIDYDYDRSGSFAGKPLEVDDTLRNFYFLLDVRF